MTRMRLGISAAIIGAIIFIAFALSVPHTRDVAVKRPVIEAPSIPVVTVHDSYKKGMHTISGSLVVPNACTPASVSATQAGNASSTQSIVLAITTELGTGICLQVPTRLTFQTTLAASSSLPIQATINGVIASTTSAS